MKQVELVGKRVDIFLFRTPKNPRTTEAKLSPLSLSSSCSTHLIENGGDKLENPNNGGAEHEVVNFKNCLRCFGVKSF